MSWSVSANGFPAEVKKELEQAFSYPLSAAPAGLSDEGERETVTRVRDMILQCLTTFDPSRRVSVSAGGHMSFQNWDTKAGANQTVNVSISAV